MKCHIRPDLDKHGNLSSTGFYRAALPQRALQALGHYCEVGDEIQVTCIGDTPVAIAEDMDVIVWQRPLDSSDVETIRLPFNGLKVVELDDDFFHLQDWSPLLVAYHQQGFTPRENMRFCIETADRLTVTTPELADLYQKWNTCIKVVPNHIEMPVWDMARVRGRSLKHYGTTSIGWAGWTHGYDLDVLMGAIEPVVNERVTFSLVGWPEAAQKFHCPVKTYPWMRIEEYRHVVASFDVGLAPLKKEQFNRGKSWLKVLEYMACGVVPVASAWHPDYSRLIDHGVDGFLARGSKEWREYIELLTEDSDLRMRMRSAGLAKAKRYDNVTHAGPLWAAAYERGMK